ncbi:TonB-dependent hemoglobin/transferrin/lactoferrin family receptor [Hydrogenophaga laconesensis]|uniref:Hemoglobin/transferrin/lactoferrin receptor protein n=1 Tax=Hydrogenophaga laconesensis TaxID=1805971 RepID=A0ABU1VCJ0_9BURK|nr:TonB-dependent hemoglobin/transferrin/lactoferrin family receptor [Hydrogenophaga laconesensis]MDR7095192.1 hemoglobin/transferrin/lactoferrin receptor protein [Hydrogenophaga laconesensis]
MTVSQPLSPSFRPHPLVLACLVLMAGPTLAQTAAPDAAPIAQAGGTSSLRELVISGSRSERAIEEVPASIDVIGGEDLDPARVQDIRDLVREIPNVSVKRAPQRFGGVTGSTGRDGNAGFNIRGLDGNRVLLTVDGIRVPRELSSGVFGSAAFGRDYYDLGLISRVEILRGANSALYGSDGLAGMVAMFTTEPKDLLKPGQTFGGRVSLRADSEDDSRGVGVTLAGAPNDTLQWLGSVQLGRSGELDNQGENHALNSTRTAPNPQKDKSASVMGKVVLTPGAGQRHTLTLEHVDKSGEVEAYTARSTTATGTLDVDGTTDMQRTRLSWDGRFKVGSTWADELRATVGYQQSDAQEVATELRTAAPTYRVRDVTYTEKLWQGVLQAEKARSLGADWGQKLVYGVDVSVSKMDNLVTGVGAPVYETYPLKRFPPTRETNTALFAQSEFVSERWSLIPALRYDRFDLKAQNSTLYPLTPASLSDSALSPKLGAIFRPTQELNLFANLAAGFKAPSALQLNNFFQNALAQYRTIPNPNLKPERSRTLEIGARDKVGPVQWEAAVFTGRYKDFIDELVVVGGVAGNPANPLTYQAVNRGQVRLSGFELKGRFALGAATDLRVAYGQTKGEDTRLGVPLNSVNPARLMVGLDHRIGDWKLGAVVSHTMRKSTSDIDYTSTPNQFAPPSYTTLDLRASWQVSRSTRLSAAIHNVTDRKYWEWTNVIGVAAGSPVLDAYSAPGRGISVALVTDF